MADFNDIAEDRTGIRDAIQGAALAPAPTVRRKPPEGQPDIHDAFRLLEKPAPPREWHVPEWIPKGDVTLFGGDGGTGKTLVALMLAYASAYGWDWLGMKVAECPVVYYGAEEPVDELHYRIEQIAKPLLSVKRQAGRLCIISVAHADAELCTFEDGKPKKSDPLFLLEKIITDLKAGLLILDAQADAFGGDEVNRREVRAFMRILRGIAIKTDCTILLLAHPSVSGMQSGRGYSGSTHWNNAVRSRLYLTKLTADDNSDAGSDLRRLEVMKANRAATGTSIMLRWRDDRFVVEDARTASDAMATAHARTVFLNLLREVGGRQKRKLSTKAGQNFAPKVLSEHPDSKGISKKSFKFAMEELLRDGKIRRVETGPPSDRVEMLEVVDAA